MEAYLSLTLAACPPIPPQFSQNFANSRTNLCGISSIPTGTGTIGLPMVPVPVGIDEIPHGFVREFAKFCENCGGIGGHAASVKDKYASIGKNRHGVADKSYVAVARRSEEIDAVSHFLHGDVSGVIVGEEGKY